MPDKLSFPVAEWIFGYLNWVNSNQEAAEAPSNFRLTFRSADDLAASGIQKLTIREIKVLLGELGRRLKDENLQALAARKKAQIAKKVWVASLRKCFYSEITFNGVPRQRLLNGNDKIWSVIYQHKAEEYARCDRIASNNNRKNSSSKKMSKKRAASATSFTESSSDAAPYSALSNNNVSTRTTKQTKNARKSNQEAVLKNGPGGYHALHPSGPPASYDPATSIPPPRYATAAAANDEKFPCYAMPQHATRVSQSKRSSSSRKKEEKSRHNADRAAPTAHLHSGVNSVAWHQGDSNGYYYPLSHAMAYSGGMVPPSTHFSPYAHATITGFGMFNPQLFHGNPSVEVHKSLGHKRSKQKVEISDIGHGSSDDGLRDKTAEPEIIVLDDFTVDDVSLAQSMRLKKSSRNDNNSNRPLGKVSIKQEKSCDYEDESLQPRNAREISLLGSLTQMGFSREEALSSIRAKTNILSLSHSEQVENLMMWMVTQREEADEARKLDMARIASENSNDGITASREAIEDALQSSSQSELFGESTSYFKSSFISKSQTGLEALSTLCTYNDDNGESGKQLVLKYLLLEQKALKWYGPAASKAYFLYDAPKALKPFAAMKNSDALASLQTELGKVETALYSLKEQQGGVPRIFLQATKSARLNGLITLESSHDGDVEVVDISQIDGIPTSSTTKETICIEIS